MIQYRKRKADRRRRHRARELWPGKLSEFLKVSLPTTGNGAIVSDLTRIWSRCTNIHYRAHYNFLQLCCNRAKISTLLVWSESLVQKLCKRASHPHRGAVWKSLSARDRKRLDMYLSIADHCQLKNQRTNEKGGLTTGKVYPVRVYMPRSVIKLSFR